MRHCVVMQSRSSPSTKGSSCSLCPQLTPLLQAAPALSTVGLGWSCTAWLCVTMSGTAPMPIPTPHPLGFHVSITRKVNPTTSAWGAAWGMEASP